ncbi:MAG: ABC-F family ATP-binding cassette domain-containing protein [Pirellulales bacterium]|nr:ABC-F family ATP-binding cassette domain-containing protein [Pirellulales bacterium]
MPVVIQLQDAFKRYGAQELLQGASCTFVDDQKVGLIGRNGCGKSTLCQILLGSEELDAGEITRSKKLRLGYLRQHNPFKPEETLLEFFLRDSGQPEWKCGEVAWKFQFPDAMLSQPVGTLSGGWQTRAKLAALLLHDPNLLILDEPTNFLDLRTQLLLEKFLQEFRGGCLIVSHDRSFLKKTCTHTLELSRGKLMMFPGNVDAYLANLNERREHERRVNATMLAKRRQLETFIAKNRANISTASQARSKAKQLERLTLRTIEGPESMVRFQFPDVEPRKGSALRTEALVLGYPDLTVARDVFVDIEHGARVGVVGDNGQGKTTFLRTICGSLKPLGGTLHWGFGCQIGVYAQHVYGTLGGKKTVQEYLEYQAAPNTTQQQVKDVAGSFLFSGDMIEKRIHVLSGGERARLVLAGLLLKQHNVLVLDEPGNHLDVETVEALADALKRYQGTVVFTSHDRHFMHRVATHVIEVHDGRVASYPASYDDYVYRVQKEIQIGMRDAIRQPARPPEPTSVACNKARAKADRLAQKKIAAIERKIARLSDERQVVHEQLLATTNASEAQRLHQQLIQFAAEIDALEATWFELQEEAE